VRAKIWHMTADELFKSIIDYYQKRGRLLDRTQGNKGVNQTGVTDSARIQHGTRNVGSLQNESVMIDGILRKRVTWSPDEKAPSTSTEIIDSEHAIGSIG
jgi:hypothetical protein